jgi:drug/metabolite transporter (DMT)-like permease
MVFTAILGIVFLGELVSRRFWVGSFLILASTVLLNFIKSKQISHITHNAFRTSSSGL